MLKKLRRVLAIVLALCIALLPMAAIADGKTENSDQQVKNSGGTKYYDKEGKETTADNAAVALSKTIEGTSLENEFDITLQVKTPEVIEEVTKEPDMAVVVVMDISSTMVDPDNKVNGVTRYESAMQATEAFLKEFAENTQKDISKVGMVAFNTDAHEVFGMSPCSTQTAAATLTKKMKDVTSGIIGNVSDYTTTRHDRFTNIEAGLQRASDMLAQSNNQDKFIIFLSDGFPTTYISSGYNGYDPYDSTGARFFDAILEKPCVSGTSYSDEAAIRARKKAASIRNNGTKIYTIGIDITGQTIEAYHKTSLTTAAWGASVIDRPSQATLDKRGGYEICGNSMNDGNAFKNWLKNSIGSGYYKDGNNVSDLTEAYKQIFSKIQEEVAAGTKAQWVASDPMPVVNGLGYVKFVGLFDRSGSLVTKLSGSNGADKENTAEYASKSNAISWDVKNSGYTTNSANGKTTYTYTLKYRVRLANEVENFVEKTNYQTNGTTSLDYRTFVGDAFGDEVSGDFPIPEVEGYFGSFSFKKVDEKGTHLAGATFTLAHNADCACHDVSINDITATSAENGTIQFTNIPSGHSYTLKETAPPAGYKGSSATYSVVVAYGKTTVNGASGLATVENKSLGKLTITKDVTGDLSEKDFDAEAFAFTVTGPGGYSKTVKLPTAEGQWTTTLSGLTAGSYTVTETVAGTKDHYQLKSTTYEVAGETLETAPTVAIRETQTASVKVENEYDYIPNGVSMTVTKVWADDSNRDGIRPDAVEFALYQNDQQVGDSVKVATPDAKDQNKFTAQFTYDANKYSASEMTVREIGYYDAQGYHEGMPAGYTATIDQQTKTVTNTHTPETVEVAVEKVWGEGTVGKQQTVTVELYKNGVKVQETEITAENNWKAKFTGLAKYENGILVVYTVKEKAIDANDDNWVAEITTNGSINSFVVTNTYTKKHTVEKIWEDRENEEQSRPASILVQLKKDGADFGEAVELNEQNGWTYTWTKLPYNADYTADETVVPDDYNKTVTTADGKTVITNTIKPKTEHTVVKVWENDTEQTRPASIMAQLKKNGINYGEAVELNEQNGWTYTWEKLPAEDAVYTVVEVAVPEQYVAETKTEQGVTTITNTYSPAPAYTTHTVIKIWNDGNGEARPASIMVQLKQNGMNYGEAVELNAQNAWTYTWEDLPVGATYGAVETAIPDGYAADTKTEGVVTTITNTLVKTTLPEEENGGDTKNDPPEIPGEIKEPELEIDKVNKLTIKKTNTETIIDEEVPLAAAPKTGDNTILLIAIIAVLAAALAATFVFDKKRKRR